MDGKNHPDDGYAAARRRMVQAQLAARGIADERVLAAMLAVPRHRFVPPEMAAEAYDDRALPIAEGQTISQPYMVALMTQWLDAGTDDSVLEIGTGSGYQAAVLACLARRVVTVERHPALSAAAETLLTDLGFANVRFVVGDGTLGWAEEAPYNRIMVTAGSPSVPESLRRQLAVGGRLVVPVGGRDMQRLEVYRRSESGFERAESVECRFVPLIGEEGWGRG